jgi:hypothetical protein
VKRLAFVLTTIVAVLAFEPAPAIAGPVGCSYTQDLGDMGPPDLVVIGNSFSTPTSYLDCYEFTLSNTADSFGGVLEIDPFANALNIDVTSVSLFAGSSLLSIDTTPLLFSFGPLSSGLEYTLAIAGTVATGLGLYTAPVAYIGAFSTKNASVPEPATMLLTALGIGSAVPFLRRRRRAGRS